MRLRMRNRKAGRGLAPRRIGEQKGQILIEVLVALAILGIVAVAFLTALTTTSLALIVADRKTTAESLTRSEFEYIERKWDTTFKFLHGGYTQFRKGSWLVPEAFVAAFTAADDVGLTIATPRVSPMFTKLKHEYGDHPQIEFICDTWASSTSLYRSHHIYVSPHLAEGFGLMPLEALATGMLCLVARCSAPMEYFSPELGWWIEMSEHYVAVEQCLPETAGFWRLPDVDSLSDVMRTAYESREQAEERGKRASEFVLANYTWQQTVAKMKAIIEETLDEETIRNNSRIQRGNVVAVGPG